MTTSSAVGSSSVTTTTGGGGSPVVYDEPEAASFYVDFTISGNGSTFFADGTWTIFFYETNGTALGNELCYEEFDFSATLDVPVPLEGCDSNGLSCVPICPYDDPGMAGSPSGTCIGRFENLVGSAASYSTNCTFADPTAWFHPSGDGLGVLERFFFSRPVENAMSTGISSFPTWGSWASELESTQAGTRSLQVQFVNAHHDSSGNFLSYSNDAFMLGAAVSDDGGANHPNAVGHHVAAMLFALIF